MSDRIQAQGYSYEPTILPPNAKGSPIYEAQIERGKQYAIDQFQHAIDRCGLRGFDVSGIQLAFNECIPFIFVDDLSRDDYPLEWAAPLHKAMNIKRFGSERPNLQKFNKAQRIEWHALSSLINSATAFHSVCDEVGDAKLDEILLPAVSDFINNLD